jgi:hypothetical protein
VLAAPSPAPAVPAAPSAAPAVAVPVAPGPPQAGSTTPGPAPAAGWGEPAGAPPAAARPPALPPAPLILAPSPRQIVPGPWNTQRRSLADLANEQLRRDRKDPLAQGMEGARREDCLRGGEGNKAPVTGLLNAPSVVGRALSGNCPR